MEQISVSGISFLEYVLCTKKSFMPQCSLCWWSRTRGTRSASPKEVHMHLSEAAIVLGFPKSCARTKNLCKAPSLAGTFRTECVGVGSRATHVIRLVHMRAPVRHNAIDLCQPRGRFAQEIVRAHDLGNKKLCDRFAQMNLVGRCSCSLLVVPHTSIRGNKEFFWDCLEKTSFRSWRKRDESSILNLI